MEYPGLAFDGAETPNKALFWLTAHELGHSWFPMIVGFDERRDAWMDEGFNTFIDVYESEDFNRGEFAPKRDSEYAPGRRQSGRRDTADPRGPRRAADPQPRRQRDREVPPPGDLLQDGTSAWCCCASRSSGPERFDPAFREFIAAWAFKHPKPADFFRAMDSAPARTSS